MKSINYDEIADTYDKRYTRAYGPEGIASKLLNLTQEVGAERILEVACGTGHWLEREGTFFLINGDIGSPPFLNNCFDMVCCINALHHFDDP
jgi:ubiquinone/menaquinone biosynthesis C-methylase UbiE